MNKSEIKRAILEAGLNKQQTLIDDFRLRIEEMKENAPMLNESQYDAQQASYNEENNERIDLLSGQLHFVEEEMELLNRLNIDAPLHDSVHIGSVVITDKRNFFVSVSLEEFEVSGINYFGISTKAPIYKVMMGKKAGDQFEFNGISYRIADIF